MALSKIAQFLAEKHSLSRLMAGREKIETDSIIGIPLTIHDVTVTAPDLKINDEPAHFAIYVFEEYPDGYVFGGQKLTEIADDLIEISQKENISIDKMDLHIILNKTKTKGNNTFTTVDFIDG